MYSVQHNNILVFRVLLATCFGHNDHHQAISQKLKKSGTHSAKSSVYIGTHLY